MPRLALVVLVLGLCGCAGGPGMFAQSGPVSNPLYVNTVNDELVWERAVEVLHEFHFEIANENRLARTIESHPRVGSGVLEPWHPDAATLGDRIEATTQSIRRTVQLSLQPSEQQSGYLVSVAVYKEKEDLPGIAANSAGAATFQESAPLERDLDPVVGQTAPSGWIPLGRDAALEQAILQRLFATYSR
ncbi:MAG: hypothetical protein KDA58_10785 [Planctomycetaceae bacterium]|nr:hypothetical protein [Planctomycetaceae bacterium]